MTFAASLESLMEDTVTIEPFSALTGGQVASYGAAVTYVAVIEGGAQRIVGADGREVISTVRVIIPERVAVDTRSRITLPSGFTPQQPPILKVEPLKGLGLDHTRVYA